MDVRVSQISNRIYLVSLVFSISYGVALSLAVHYDGRYCKDRKERKDQHHSEQCVSVSDNAITILHERVGIALTFKTVLGGVLVTQKWFLNSCALLLLWEAGKIGE